MTAWKDLERRVCRALGGERSGPLGRLGSDCNGTPFAVEVKRTTRPCLRGEWLEQARAHQRREGRPWLLVIAGHGDRRPVAVMDFWELAELAQKAGLLPTPLVVEPEEAA